MDDPGQQARDGILGRIGGYEPFMLGKHRCLGRLQHAIEPAQDHNRKHDETVLGWSVGATPIVKAQDCGVSDSRTETSLDQSGSGFVLRDMGSPMRIALAADTTASNAPPGFEGRVFDGVNGSHSSPTHVGLVRHMIERW